MSSKEYGMVCHFGRKHVFQFAGYEKKHSIMIINTRYGVLAYYLAICHNQRLLC